MTDDFADWNLWRWEAAFSLGIPIHCLPGMATRHIYVQKQLFAYY